MMWPVVGMIRSRRNYGQQSGMDEMEVISEGSQRLRVMDLWKLITRSQFLPRARGGTDVL